jgi:hypothetical protein
MTTSITDVVAPESVDLGVIRLNSGREERVVKIRRQFIIPNPANPRDDESLEMADPDFALLERSYRRHGWLPGSYLTVLDQGDSTYLILSGHRRFKVSGLCGIDDIPCVVLPVGSLTVAEQLRLVLDHQTTASLKPGELLNAFMKCRLSGFSRDMTCRTLGWVDKNGKLNQNTYKKYLDVSTLPPDDQEIWKAYASHGRSATIKNVDGQIIPLPYIPDTETTKRLVNAVAEAKKKGHDGLKQTSEPYKAVMETILAGKKDITSFTAKDFGNWADLEPRLPLMRLWLRLKGAYTKREMADFHAMLRWMHDVAFGPPQGMTAFRRPSFLDTPEWRDEPVAAEPVAAEPVAAEPVAAEPVAAEPVAAEPVAEEPVAEEPVAAEPVAAEPVAAEPVAEEPVAEEPVAEEPVAVKILPEMPTRRKPEPVRSRR